MAEKKQSQEVIIRTERCKQIVKLLERENIISVGAEGIKLGKEGALLLLQIGNMKGDVFVFDVGSNSDLFEAGNLKSLLESDTILKVVHSCSCVSAVLKFQFDVHLKTVFDTQVAHIVIQEAKGCRLPVSVSIENICKLYSDIPQPIYKDKQAIKLVCEKVNAAYWATRPLTKEMIQYVAGDVRSLIPDVYTNLKQKLDDFSLWSLFRRRVDEELMTEWSPVFKNMRSDRTRQAMNDVIKDMEDKYESYSSVDYMEISEEEQKAIELLPYSEFREKRSVMKVLKNMQVSEKLRELDDELEQLGSDFIPDDSIDEFLRDIKGHADENIRKKATKIHDGIKLIVLGDVGNKYGIDTPLTHLKEIEKRTLGGLVYLNNYNSVVQSLATKVKVKECLALKHLSIRNR